MEQPYDNSEVRRQDRLMDKAEATMLLRKGEYGFLALGGGDGYGIPLNYVADDGRIYFHCAPEGKKIRRIGTSNRASFCVVGDTEPQPEKFTTLYQSVMAFGTISIVADPEERMQALMMLVDKYCPGLAATGEKYARASFGRTAVLRLDIERVSGKAKRAVGK